MDNLTILSIILAFAAVVTFLLMTFMPKQDKKENVDILTASDKTHKSIIEKILKKIEDMEQQDKEFRRDILSLQRSLAIEYEQTKFLTAAVNKNSNPIV